MLSQAVVGCAGQLILGTSQILALSTAALFIILSNSFWLASGLLLSFYVRPPSIHSGLLLACFWLPTLRVLA